MNVAFPERQARLATVMLVMLLAACTSTPKARVDQDSHVNFANYKTFAWVEPKPADEAAAKATVTTLAGQRVRTSVTAALQAKGYTLDETHPDVRVTSILNVYDRPKQSGMSIGLGAGGGSGNVGGGIGVSLPVGKRNETVGAMTVDVIDATRNEQVWTGSYEMIVSEKGATDADVQTMTDAIMAKYPVSGK